MRKNLMRGKIGEGKPVIGFTLLAYWPDAVDIVGELGADYIMIDGEHGSLSLPEVAGLIRACEAIGVTPLVRASRNAADLFLGYLDAGAQGIVVPNVNTAAEAERAVKAIKYWPMGNRGCGYGHAMHWLVRQPFAEYAKQANEETLVCIQIESVQGVENLAEICRVPGVDIIWPGPNDLAHSLGLIGQLDHPQVKAAIARIDEITLASGKWLCAVAPSGDAARQAFAAGAHLVNYGMHRLLVNGARDYLARARPGG